MTDQLHDADLASLVSALGLHAPAGVEEWEDRLRGRLDAEVYAAYLEFRYGYAREPGPDANAAFYEFVGGHPELALLMQEGRLGYHFAVLPAVAEALGRGPHGTIADLGCNGGLTTLYLARRFPASRVVGIDRCAGLVERARELRERAGVPNAEFVHSDYTRPDFEGPFDAVVSLQSMPAYFLPTIPSETPESYRRGASLLDVADDPVLPSRRVAWALAGVRRLAAAEGRVVLHERLGDVSRVLLFSLFAARAGLRIQQMRPVSWEAPAEMEPGRRTCPLVVAEAQAGPAAFEEDAVIALCQPRPARAELPAPPAPGSNSAIVLSGPLAQHYYDSLPAPRRDVCVRAVLADGRQRHFHLGVAGTLVYSYACDTWDGRALKVAGLHLARSLLGPEAEAIVRAVRSGEVAAIDPKPESLAGLLQALLRP